MNIVFLSSYAQSDEFGFVNLNDSYSLGEEFSIVFQKITHQPCPSYEISLMKEGIPESEIHYGAETLCAISGSVEPYLFSGTFEKPEFFDSIGTYLIQITLDNETINKKIQITNPESSYIHSPLKQITLGVSIDDIQCKEHLVLLKKYDGAPACVKPATIERLIERGWTETLGDIQTLNQSDLSNIKSSAGVIPFESKRWNSSGDEITTMPYDEPESSKIPVTQKPDAPPGHTMADDHQHASILVKIFGDKFDFSLPSYQIRSSWIHFEGNDGNTIHRHSKGIELGYFFDTLSLGLSTECFVFQDKREFCTNDDYTLKFYINGNQVPDIQDYVIMDNDRILISYGAEDTDEIKEQLMELESQELIT